jgi:hypothetical protein
VLEVMSPLASILGEALKALRARRLEPGSAFGTAQDTVNGILDSLKTAVRYGEVNSALDLEGLALLSAAAVAGLRRLEEEAPGIFALERGVHTLADLIRRTAPEATGW